MAVTRGATTSRWRTSIVDDTDLSISHTVDSGTTLLLVSMHMFADASVSGTPSWSLGGGENLTLVRSSTSSGLAGDQHTEVWGLVNPTSGSGTVSITITAFSDAGYSTAVNYIGTETASVAAATNYLSETVNDSETSSTAFSSAGTSGNCLYVAANAKGADMGPASNASSFTELFDEETGGSSSSVDLWAYVADLLNSAPSAVTVSWDGVGAPDENCGIYVEVVASTASSAASSVILMRNRGY